MKLKTISQIEFIYSYLTRRIRIEDKIYDVNQVSKESWLIKVILPNLCKYENYAVCVYTSLGFFLYQALSLDVITTCLIVG